jgi:hypothetical protein
MHKTLIALAAASSLGLATLAVPSTADARCFGCAVGAGIIGGIAAGAIIGAAAANAAPPPPPPPGAYYGPPPPGYYPPPPPYAAAPGPAYAQLPPGCRVVKKKVWVENVGYRIRPIQVCH